MAEGSSSGAVAPPPVPTTPAGKATKGESKAPEAAPAVASTATAAKGRKGTAKKGVPAVQSPVTYHLVPAEAMTPDRNRGAAPGSSQTNGGASKRSKKKGGDATGNGPKHQRKKRGGSYNKPRQNKGRYNGRGKKGERNDGYAGGYGMYPDPATIRYWVLKQTEFYFSDQNLASDVFLRRHMDVEGYVPIALLMSFARIQTLCPDPVALMLILSKSAVLDVDTANEKVRRKENWEQYRFPQPDGSIGVPLHVKVRAKPVLKSTAAEWVPPSFAAAPAPTPAVAPAATTPETTTPATPAAVTETEAATEAAPEAATAPAAEAAADATAASEE